MALFALYRVRASDLVVLLSDVRGRVATSHCCTLPNHPWLIKDLTETLERMGFDPELDRKIEKPTEVRFFCVHRHPSEPIPDPVDAIRDVCDRHHLSTKILSYQEDSSTLLVPNLNLVTNEKETQ